MRFIGNLTDQKQAERFVAYLVTQEIQSHVEPEKDVFEVWIKDEDAITTAMDEFKAFEANPDDQKYSDAPVKAREIQNELIKKRQRIARNVVNVSATVGKRNHPLTILLMVICGLVALLTNFGTLESFQRAPFRSLAFNAQSRADADKSLKTNGENVDAVGWRLSSISKGEVWRLVTPIFLHFGVMHLVFNMYWLFLLGGQIENRYGTFWFGMLVLASAVISNVAQCVVPIGMGGSSPGQAGEYYVTLMGGMSGVNYATFGFIWMRMMYDRNCGLYLTQLTIFFLLGWLIFCMTPVASEVGLSVANWAHAIGMLVGVIAGYFPTVLPKRPART